MIRVTNNKELRNEGGPGGTLIAIYLHKKSGPHADERYVVRRKGGVERNERVPFTRDVGVSSSACQCVTRSQPKDADDARVKLPRVYVWRLLIISI